MVRRSPEVAEMKILGGCMVVSEKWLVISEQ
jgi:hypothetical protein